MSENDRKQLKFPFHPQLEGFASISSSSALPLSQPHLIEMCHKSASSSKGTSKVVFTAIEGELIYISLKQTKIFSQFSKCREGWMALEGVVFGEL